MGNNTKSNKPMPKWLIYFLFIFKFILGLYLIYWTIYETLQSDVGKDDDSAFLSTYHIVDKNFAKIAKDNTMFNKKYNIKFKFNNTKIYGIDYGDIYLSQRIIKDRKIRKNMLQVGTNTLTVMVQDKKGNIVKNVLVKMLITKNNTHTEDVNIELKDKNSQKFDIKSMGYWNITGVVEIDGLKGNFYIKTNAK